ncbi:MAG: thioether cross-link-forming SCIFF peptide maturase [Tissierellia bacterium]|nr:thioether cross-link-forming SCIFF peptide maturase [Tissierellia bacterium]
MKNIHKFNINDRYIVLDIYSGSIFVVDELTYNILEYFDYGLDFVLKSIKDKPENKVIEVFNEIKSLVEEGYLGSDEIDVSDISYNRNNIIKAMCLHVAHDCDLRCKYCFASQGDFCGERSLMTFETGKRALEFLVENSGNRRNLEVDFFGGEPLLNFEVVKKLTLYGEELNKKFDKNIRFTITTNGVSLDDDKIDFINKYMSNVVMSLDGRREVNDRMRPTVNGKGSYDIIVPKFKKLISKRGDKDYYIRGTFTSFNLDFSKDAIQFYNEGFKNISIEPVVTEERMPYALKREHLEKILEEYEEFSKFYMDVNKEDDNLLFFHFVIDLNDGPCLAKRSVGCGAGAEYISVTPTGEIYPCHQFVGDERFLMGDLNRGIVNSSIREDFKHSNVFTKDDCKSCWAKFYCSGGCHANAFYNNDTIMKPYSLGCEMEKKRLECAISILANK